MNIYLVERKDDVDYDEYDALVIAARTVNNANAIVMTGYYNEYYSGFDASHNWSTTKIGETDKYDKPQLIIGSFNTA